MADDIVDNIWSGDCREKSLDYVRDKARMIGAAAFAMSCFTVSYKYVANNSFKCSKNS